MIEFSESTTIKLTEQIVKQAVTPASRIELRDTAEKGLVLRISSTGHKTFAFKCRRGSTVKTLTLGPTDRISLKEAKVLALEKRIATLSANQNARPSSPIVTTLAQLVAEAEINLSQRKKGYGIWTKRVHRKKPDAVSAIQNVFSSLLDRDVSCITADEIWKVASSHKRKPRKKKAVEIVASEVATPDPRTTTTPDLALKQASRALSYLATMFDWGSHRNEFQKIGEGREISVDLPDLASITRPGSGAIRRSRYLNADELAKIYPECMNHNGDEGKAAHGFILATVSRCGEVSEANWSDFDLVTGVWTKRVKGGDVLTIGLPRELVDWLKELPSYRETGGVGPVFRNTKKRRFRSWSAVTRKIQDATGTSGWNRHDKRRTSVVHLIAETSDADPLFEILTHATPKPSQKTSGAVVQKMFNRLGEEGAFGHYAPDSAAPIINNRITRTRAMCAKLMRYYGSLAQTRDHTNRPE